MSKAIKRWTCAELDNLFCDAAQRDLEWCQATDVSGLEAELETALTELQDWCDEMTWEDCLGLPHTPTPQWAGKLIRRLQAENNRLKEQLKQAAREAKKEKEGN